MKTVSVKTAGGGRVASGRLSEYCERFRETLELIGRRWTGAILRALISRPHRFSELLGVVPGLSDRLLTARLKELESEGLVERRVLGGPPIAVEYSLTARGRDLEEIVRAVDRWVQRWVEVRPKAG